jgi:hypothetical protein
MERKYNIWKNTSLSIRPKIGVLYKNYKLIFKEIINLNDFSNDELCQKVKIYSRSHLRTILDEFYQKGYLNTYLVNKFPRTYRYKITDTGLDFFNNPPIDDNRIEENL